MPVHPSAPKDALRGRTILMSGGSRGIGLAIAQAAAEQGANVVMLAKTDTPHPRLPGTVHTAVEAVEAAGGRGLAVVGDVRSEDDVRRAVDAAVDRFGGIDVVVNNASAIDLTPTQDLPLKKMQLMHDINVQGTWLLTRTALPHLARSDDGRVVTLSPPINLAPHWLGTAPTYTITKYSMSLLTLGWAGEQAATGVAFSTLWPQTLIATAAVFNVVGGGERARDPRIMGDAASVLLTAPRADVNGRSFIDVDLLAQAGVTDLAPYGGGAEPQLDIYVDPA